MEIIEHADGSKTLVNIQDIPALEAWDLQADYTAFCLTTDKAARRAFTMHVLSFATVVMEEVELPLKTDALINNHLRTWTGIRQVFEAVLMRNGINPATHAEKPHYWSNAGSQMAVAFVAEASQLIAPAFQMLEKKTQE